MNSLVLTATANNTTLVPASALAFGGSGADRTLTVTPAANQNGSATITVTVSDGSSPPHAPSPHRHPRQRRPHLSSLADQQTIPGGVVGPLPLAVDDIDSPADSLTLSATSSDPDNHTDGEHPTWRQRNLPLRHPDRRRKSRFLHHHPDRFRRGSHGPNLVLGDRDDRSSSSLEQHRRRTARPRRKCQRHPDRHHRPRQRSRYWRIGRSVPLRSPGDVGRR
ncbi:MAG: Ig-like domain-containing protein [Verrucomicrobia bacterium]|nr:Ig-like domain-containing protein [Verrucomicrobiota bacterium]